jgi:TM2 domain-containing membrane protein YozV
MPRHPRSGYQEHLVTQRPNTTSQLSVRLLHKPLRDKNQTLYAIQLKTWPAHCGSSGSTHLSTHYINTCVLPLRLFLSSPRLRTTREDMPMARPGSGGNVLPALCSFFIPGLGQLLQGRLGMALVQFVLAGILWFFWIGWFVHLWSVIEAAQYTSTQEAT